MVTDLESRHPGKWRQVALGSTANNKANGDNGIPVELFKILKCDAAKVLYSTCQWIWKTQKRPQDWKRSVYVTVLRKGSTKECVHITKQLCSFHMPARLCLKLCKLSFHRMWTKNWQKRRLIFEETDELETKLPLFARFWRKQRSDVKPSTSALLATLKPLIVWITTKCGKSSKRWENHIIILVSWGTCI